MTGIVKPGQLCAIMGASGAGKTTLLNVINFRNQTKLEIEGEIKLNGTPTCFSLSVFKALGIISSKSSIV